MTPAQIAQIRDMVEDGYTTREIGTEMSLSFSHVASTCRKHGIPTRGRGGARKGTGRAPILSADQTRALVATAKEEGLTQPAAARIAGVSHCTLRNALTRYGVAWWR